jgi:O-antigen/teichoic acid export membrane protein
MIKTIKSKVKGIFLRLEVFLQTDLKYIAIHGSWLLSSQVVSNFCSFFLVIAFGNLLPKATYGTYKYILSISGILMLTSLSDMSTAVIKGVAEGFENMYRQVVETEIKWGLLGTLGSLSLAAYYFYKGNHLFGYAFIITAITIPLFDTSNTYSYILAGKKRFDIQAKFNMAARIISALTLIATLFLTKNLLFVLLAYFLPYILIGFLIGPIVLRRLDLNKKHNPEIMTYGKHLSFLSAIAFGVNYLDSIIVFQFLGPIKLAVYSIASAPVNRLQGFLAVVPEVALPKLAERPIEELKATLTKRVFKSMLLAGAMVALYILIVPLFFKLFLPKYTDSILYAQLMAVPLIWYPFVIISRVLSAKGATKFLYKYNIIESAVQLGTMLLMIRYFGLFGAAIGRIFVSLFGTVLMYSYFKKL